VPRIQRLVGGDADATVYVAAAASALVVSRAESATIGNVNHRFHGWHIYEVLPPHGRSGILPLVLMG
jgi:hypothetical protein